MPLQTKLQILFEIPNKLRLRGFRWFCRRSIQELLAPHHALGRFLRKVFMRTQQESQNTIESNRLLACYDLELSPVTFDLVWFLMGAEMAGRKLNKQKVHLLIIPAVGDKVRVERSEYEKIINRDSRLWRIQAILLPIINMFCKSDGFTIFTSRDEAITYLSNHSNDPVYPEFYNVYFPVEFRYFDVNIQLKKYSEYEGFNASSQARIFVETWLTTNIPQGIKPVVITLRQYNYMPSRNSNLDAWAKFAKNIDKRKYWPVFIPDTQSAFDPLAKQLENFTFFNEAAWNLELRMAIYEAAHINFVINNGPASLCHFNPNCRYIYLKIIDKDCFLATEDYFTSLGLTVGQQPTFIKLGQKWVWENDTIDVIEREFKEMCELLTINDNS